MSRNAAGWYLQRITGAALVPLLIAHFWVEHFRSATLLSGDLTYAAILSRIANPWWQAVDISFLVIALFHGLHGLFGILVDFGKVGPRGSRAIALALVLVGVAWAFWGIEAFRHL